MRKATLISALLLLSGSIGFPQITGAQVPAQDPGNPPGLQNIGNAPCVRIAVIDSQKALERSAEGRKLLAKAGKLTKKKLEEELERIRNEMVDVIDKIAREKGYGLVLDRQTAGIIKFLPPVDDLTDELIERYNSLIR